MCPLAVRPAARTPTAFFLATLLSASAAAAQQPANGRALLQQAEEAYLQVDIEATEQLAQRAIEVGHNTVEDTARIYALLGWAAALQQHDDAARDAFVKMLAIKPDSRMDSSLGPRLQSPFLEARGFWAAQAQRLGAEVSLSEDSDDELAVSAAISDPLGMAGSVVVRTRPAGQRDFRETRHPASRRVRVPVAGGSELRYVDAVVVVLDERGNEIIRVGTDVAPQRLRGPGATTGPTGPTDSGPSIFSSPWFWVISGAVLVGAAVTIYALFLAPPDHRAVFGVSF